MASNVFLSFDPQAGPLAATFDGFIAMPRLFVSEYVCGGGWPAGCPEGSLRVEGEAMLKAVAADFARIPDVHVVTTWDSRLGPFGLEGVTAYSPRSVDDEWRLFSRLAGECDATLVIAPEFHDQLGSRCEAVVAAGGSLLGPAPTVVRLCGDKLELARRLAAAGIPVVPTFSLDREYWPLASAFPIVIKPRHGAGSVNTFRLNNEAELQNRLSQPFDPPDLPPTIWQSFVPGRSLSASVLVRSGAEGGFLCDHFPIGEQRLSDDGRFSYRGGKIPTRIVRSPEIPRMVEAAIASLPDGVQGYLGFDILLPNDLPEECRILEINPRLTTSYLGYRELAKANLAERWWQGECAAGPVEWGNGSVEFSPQGGSGVLS